MRIFFEDGFSVEKGTGIGRYTQNLINELAKYQEVEVLRRPARTFIEGIRPSSARRVAYGVWLETAFQRQIERLGPDLVHFTNYLVPRSRKSKAKYVVTIHDMTAWKMPEALPYIYRRYIRKAISRSVSFADLILCPSDAIRNEVIEHFKLRDSAVRTAWNASSTLPELPSQEQEALASQFRRKVGLRKPFILFVGTLECRKNVTTLVKAFARVAETHDLQLVLAGRPGHGFSKIEETIQRQACHDRYVVTGYVSDVELALLYSIADLFAYPSRYEGFGIPLVEAMSFGVPIVASRIPASEEVTADAALYYDDPKDDATLAGKIVEVLDSSTLKSELIASGKQRAIAFRWDRVARMYIDAYSSSLKAL